jgi:hypothetical protein
LELKNATLLDAASTLYDTEKRKTKAKAVVEEADAQKRLAEASMILKEREAEVRKKRAEARESEANAKKTDAEAAAISLKAQSEAFDKLTDALIRLRREGCTIEVDPAELAKLLTSAGSGLKIGGAKSD